MTRQPAILRTCLHLEDIVGIAIIFQLIWEICLPIRLLFSYYTTILGIFKIK